MKTYTKQQLIKQLIVGGVLAIITCIIMLASGIWDVSGSSVGALLIMIPMVLICLPISYMSFFFINWKKAIIGFFAPIPVLSNVIENLKGLGRTFGALFALIKGNDSYTFNKYGVEENSDEE